MTASIVGVGTALPEEWMTQEDLWEGYFSRYYRGNGLARRIWLRSGVARRHGVVNPIEEDVPSWGTGARMRRFVEEAVPLGRRALEAALADARAAPSDVDLLTVVSCTGYATPGLDILLARELGLTASVERLHVGHMGCYAALPALATAADAVAARRKTALVLCVELTTLHTQPPTDDLEQIVAHALFADAAAAVALAPDADGFELVDVEVRTDVERAGLMTWDVTDLGFRMGLSPLVPDVLEEHVGHVARALLARNGLELGDVAHWVVHPGGPKILEGVEAALGLEPALLDDSRAVLRDCGNCSSATVLLILDRLRKKEVSAGDTVLALAFGPGLTLYAALLRKRGR